jgi:hypothetical protein
MRIIRAVGLIVVGIVIGVIAAGYWSPVNAQISGPRFSMVDGNNVASSGVLIVKDSKSAGCWLLAQGGQGVALAPAPAEACR